jgi:NAD(P)-dependent dehydrogenase (short-subunit alcohol dehydrogenase family)
MPDQPSVVITGISRGIGHATALAFARLGYGVAGIHRSADPAVTETLRAEIGEAGGDPLIHIGSIADGAALDALADATAERWGGISAWVNNASGFIGKPFVDTTDAEWRELLDANLFGYVWGCRAAARHMLPARRGTIINISSAADPHPPSGIAAYTTAKAGVNGLTRALGVEFGMHGVTVNTVSPGPTETPINTAWTEEIRATYRKKVALGRIAEAEDVADAIVMMASAGARFITGQTVLVDGGMTINGTV